MSKWLQHVKKTMQKNRGMKFKNVLKLASRSWKKQRGGGDNKNDSNNSSDAQSQSGGENNSAASSNVMGKISETLQSLKNFSQKDFG